MRKFNLLRAPRTLAEINKVIQSKYPDVILVKGKGYFYISSDNKEMGEKLAGLFTTSIEVNSLGQQTIERWMWEVDHLMSGIDQDGELDGSDFNVQIKEK